ncbi:MAG: 2-dehydropantoate 2-reductase [Chloroflexi bacterium]|nr:MAG: 2-dehydropantoate 2-reductase [Chloroflexota bacterium]MBL1195840.1 2-dehydropantoate 2-reductase [Chloroflexota bacterium]NOH13132.1 2-dehydropantoate 2-reductase [Chloroflexota bacterium]
MSAPLKILVYGAGAIGTYVGGSLALNGHEVTFQEIPQAAEYLRENGFRLNIDGQTKTIIGSSITASVKESLEQGPFDVCVFALKSYDTEAALKQIAPHSTDFPPILCLQNGVENEAAITEVLGPDKVIAGTVTSALGKPGPGEVTLERLRGVGIATNHPLSRKLAEAFNEAGLNAQLFRNAAAMKWSKLLTNLLANASSAILDMPPGEIFANPSLYKLEIMQLREALAVMRAQNIPVVDLPGTPVRALAFAARSLPLGISRPLLTRAVGRGRGAKMPSFHIDLHSGRGKSEVGWLNGVVAGIGKELSIKTPVNQLLAETLSQLTSGQMPLDKYQHKAKDFLRQLP